MLKTLLWTCVLIALAVPMLCAQAQEPEIERLRSLELRMIESYRQRQVEIFASLLDEDFVITFEDGSVYSKTGYLSFMVNPSVRVDLTEIKELKVRLHGTTAILTGAYHERGEDKGGKYELQDRFTDVWIKRSGKWVLAASHYGVPVH